ncbi:peroxidase [cyanobacterium TDX16]|nr:peroxidase [cyanobacterium TDX16]
MSRLKAVTVAGADRRSRGLLDGVEKKLGMVPNIMRTMASSPATLEAYLAFSNAMATGSLSAKLREQVALAVGEANNCEYCLAAHAALGRRAGLNDDEVTASRRGASADQKAAAVLTFAQKVVVERGRVGDADVASLRAAGYGDGEIAEIVGNVALNIFTNYFNHVAQTEIDFPKVQGLTHTADCSCAA